MLTTTIHTLSQVDSWQRLFGSALIMPMVGIAWLIPAAMGAASLIGNMLSNRSKANANKKSVEQYKREKAAADRAQWEAERAHFEGPGGTRDLLAGTAKSMGLDLPISQMTYKPFSPDDPDAMTPENPGIGSYLGQILSGGAAIGGDIYQANKLQSDIDDRQASGSDMGSGDSYYDKLIKEDMKGFKVSRPGR